MIMQGIIGFTRAEVNLYESTDSSSAVIDVLSANVPLKIIEQVNDWLRVRPLGSFSGYLQADKVLITDETIGADGNIFSNTSNIPTKPENIPSIPEKITPRTLTQWLSVGGKPSWIPESYWQTLSSSQQQGVVDAVKAAIIQRIDSWNAWIKDIQQQGRIEEATIGEWLTILQGGRNYFALLGEKMYKTYAFDDDLFIGWINANDLITWTGHVKRDEKKPENFWYEVITQRFNEEVKGWVTNFNRFDTYSIPTDSNNPAIEENAEKVFNLDERLLRYPQDTEIQDAVNKGFNAAQYIDLTAVLGHPLRHYNLCGIFAVAALGGHEVIPTLNQWKGVYSRARDIIKDPGEGTSTRDLQSLLSMFKLSNESINIKIEKDQFAFLSANRLRELLHQGTMLITGVNIKGNGKLSGEGNIRHWVVVEDVLPVGNSGWVRLYNSFHNMDEVYTYRTFIASFNAFGSITGAGLWVNHPRMPITLK